jgi:phospholipid-translocating ATPase
LVNFLKSGIPVSQVICEDDYETFKRNLESAKQNMVDREEMVREAYGEMESGLHLVGATGIEDLLQEDVVETIEKVCLAKNDVLNCWTYRCHLITKVNQREARLVLGGVS